MRYAGMPMGMWALFKRSFRERLVSELGFSERDHQGGEAEVQGDHRKAAGV